MIIVRCEFIFDFTYLCEYTFHQSLHSTELILHRTSGYDRSAVAPFELYGGIDCLYDLIVVYSDFLDVCPKNFDLFADVRFGTDKFSPLDLSSEQAFSDEF